MRTTIGTATLEIIHRARLVHACQAPTCCVAAAHGLVESGERRGGAAAFASTYREFARLPLTIRLSPAWRPHRMLVCDASHVNSETTRLLANPHEKGTDSMPQMYADQIRD